MWPGIEASLNKFNAQVHYLMVHDIGNFRR